MTAAAKPIVRTRRHAAVWASTRLIRLVSLLALSGSAVTGCALRGGGPPPSVQAVEIRGQVQISRDRAHATFQGGRQVGGANQSLPYCQLEVNTVAQQPVLIARSHARVTGERQTLLKDAVTRIPALIAGFSCSDALFQESIWYLDGGADSDLRHLRCIAPYFNCQIGPPLSPAQVQAVVGPGIRVFAADEPVEPGSIGAKKPE